MVGLFWKIAFHLEPFFITGNSLGNRYLINNFFFFFYLFLIFSNLLPLTQKILIIGLGTKFIHYFHDNIFGAVFINFIVVIKDNPTK
jgi:hypothetical protein